jgi:CDP-diacylglycerol pyrophosphatase
MQSALTRGQHQLHIHIGTLPEHYQKALSLLPPTPLITQRVNINNHDSLVRYIPHRVANEPYLDIDLFVEASNMLPLGEADMPRYGLMTALSADQAGVYLIAALGLDRSELNYRQPYQCKLTTANNF